LISTQFRTFGGTVGLAQCSAVLNAKVRSGIIDIVSSGRFSLTDLAKLASLGKIDSLNDIDNLSPELASAVRDAFRQGVRWAFISLIPWVSIATIMVLFLSKIPDSDLKKRSVNGTTRVQDNGTVVTRESEMVAPSTQEKPKIYGPISLIIYLFKKQRAKRRAAAAAQNAEKTPEPETGDA